MEKINEEAEERFNKWLERTPNGRVAMAYDAWMEQQKIIDSLQAECLKYREALEQIKTSGFIIQIKEIAREALKSKEGESK
jgi:hypothetical protein